MLAKIGDFFFPKTCVFCDTQGSLVCKLCKNSKLVYYNSQFCHVCKQEVFPGFVHENCHSKTALDGVLVAVHYNQAAGIIMEELKYNLYFSIAAEVGMIIKKVYKKSNLGCEALIPVPLHKFKENYRGFNQAELLARSIGPKVDKCLVRTKNTKTQVNLNRKQRQENLKDVFRLKYPIHYKIVVLVDDVMTTGTTLEECAQVLKVGGVEQVYGLVFARD